jgi:hypothetical protein
LSRAVIATYLVSLALLPWTWFPPFPWLHEHAQWSDAVFAVAATLWLVERSWLGGWPRLQRWHVALALYPLLAFQSLLVASPDPLATAPKLLGVVELCTLAFITADLASRPGISRRIGQVIALTSLVTAAASIAALLFFYAGVDSRLIGIYGELEPSPFYARVQAGTYNPNLLASFCIFAAAIVARRESELPPWLRRLTLGLLSATALLTFSRGILGFATSLAIQRAGTPRGKKVATAIAIGCAVLVVSVSLWRPKLDPTHPMEIGFLDEDSSRFEGATSSLVALARHPLFGTGLGTSPGAYHGVPFDAHLTLVNIAATLGLPALMAFTALMASIWRRRRRPTDLAVWGGLTGLAIDSLGQDIEDFRHLWVLIGLASVPIEPDEATEGGAHVRVMNRR